VDLARCAAAALEFAAALEEEDVTAVAALPRVKAEAMVDKALEQARPLDARGTLTLASGAGR
jgi:hypothetical protein